MNFTVVLKPDPEDGGYVAILAWAKQKGGPTHVPTDVGFPFFAHRVQPMLVKKGCMMLQCHSASMFHDSRVTMRWTFPHAASLL